MLIGADMALDVGDINEALSFYEFELRSNSDATGFVELATGSSRCKKHAVSQHRISDTSWRRLQQVADPTIIRR
jgi:hypothetical protein